MLTEPQRPQPDLGRTALSPHPWHHPAPEPTAAAPLAVSLSLNRKLPVADQVYEALKKAIIRCS